MPDILDTLLEPLDTLQNIRNTGNSLITSAGNIAKGIANTLNTPVLLIIGGLVVIIVIFDK